MKSLIFAITMLATAASFAKPVKAQGVLEYKVKQATYSSEHVQNATSAQLVLNYNKATVALNIQVAFHCPEGRVCAQVMPAPIRIELPIVSVQTDGCGIRNVTALVDRRPVDGDLQQIKVSDPSNMTCRTFVAVEPKATYTTSYYDRRNGKTVTDESKMILSLVSVKAADVATESDSDVLEMSLAPSILVKYVINSGFSPNPTVQTLYVDKIGRVINSVKVVRTQQVTTTEIAQLSPAALKNLNEKIATIPATAKLVDEQQGEPSCMDAPTSTISVTVNHQDVPVFQRTGCHNLATEEGESATLRDVMMGFVSLTY